MATRYIHQYASSTLLSVLLFTFCFPIKISATNYYLSNSGDDSQNGNSLSTAWQSLSKIKTTSLQPGDSILLHSGHTFIGRIEIGPNQGGTPTQPIVICSTGSLRASIEADGEYGIFVDDCAGIEIRNLNIMAAATPSNDGDGILFRRSRVSTQRSQHIRIEDVEISGFKWGGITIDLNEDSVNLEMGYEDVLIQRIKSHDNPDHGIQVKGVILSDSNYSNKNVVVRDCEVFRNYGIPSKDWSHTGNGIVIGNTLNALIQYSLAYDNGRDNFYNSAGPVGIWMWDTKNGTIENSEVYNQQSGNNRDGGGFDLDGGCQNCTIQYCYSHDNEGPGYMLAEFKGARPLTDNVLRYNISENDGRTFSRPSLLLWRQGNTILSGLDCYHNTFYQTKPGNLNPKIIEAASTNIQNVRFINNIFVSLDNLVLVQKNKDSGQEIKFYNNVYHTGSGNLVVKDNNNTYNSLQSWRTASGQEMLNGDTLGFELDPMLNNPGRSIIVGNPQYLDTLSSYQLDALSIARNMGIDMLSEFGIDRGNRDFFNQSFDPQMLSSPGADAGVLSTGSTFPLVELGFRARRLEGEKVLLEAERPAFLAQEEVWVQRSDVYPWVYQDVGTMRFTAGKGTFKDNNLSRSNSYYRLIWKGIDGRAYYSKEIEVTGLGMDSGSLKVFYDTTQSRMLLFYPSFKGEQAIAEIMSLTGKVIVTGRVDTHGNQPHLQLKTPLPAGLYFLVLRTVGPYQPLSTQFFAY